MPTDPQGLSAAIALLRAGALVVFPTETFYALGADPAAAGVVAQLREVKGRGAGQGLPLIAASRAAVDALGAVPKPLQPCCAALWPGPLSVVLPADHLRRPSILAPGVAAADGSAAVRCSSHPVAAQLAQSLDHGLLISTSANDAGASPAASPAALGGRFMAAVRLILDGGVLPGGVPSTLLAATPDGVVALREGAVLASTWAATLTAAGRA